MTTPKSAASRARILLVDDEQSTLSGLTRLLSTEGFEVVAALNGNAAIALAREHCPDVVITDLTMPGMNGIALLHQLHTEHGKTLPVIVVTATSDLSLVVEAMRSGAEDYLTKPIDLDALILTIERALEHRNLREEAEGLRLQIRERDREGLRGLIGASPPMQKIYDVARRVADSRANVLITGESGTGKGELARVIHSTSSRSDKPFVQLHCAALPESLLEAELFGHEKGAFTGADRRRVGRFEQAEGGTLFLDEIGEIPMLTQVKLLRILQERTFERLGSNQAIQADVRVIAATNRDLAADVQAGRFREDLYYRLNVVHIEMPPLRLRGSDIVTLAEHFLRKLSRENRRVIDGFSEGARTKLLGHRWPGNVRELENAVERAIVLCQNAHIEAEDLPIDDDFARTSSGEFSIGAGPAKLVGSTMAQIERVAILKTLEACDGSTTRAAEMLDISVRTIQYRLHQYGVARPSIRPSSSSIAPKSSSSSDVESLRRRATG